MSGYFKNRFSTATAIGTGIGHQPVLFDYTTGQLVVKIQVAGAANFEARGNDALGLKQDYDAKLATAVPSMAGLAGKAVAAAPAQAAAAAAQAAARAAAAAQAAASGVRSAAKGTAQRVAGVANVLWRGKRALAPQAVGGRSRKNRKNRSRKNRKNTRRN
jgi:hypothetical protein